MGHKNHITELTENKQIVVHKEERKKYLKKRGEHTTEKFGNKFSWALAVG